MLRVGRLRVRKTALVACGVAGTVVAAQALSLAVRYKSPPDALGPKDGVEVYVPPRSMSELQQQSRELVDDVSKRVQNVWTRLLTTDRASRRQSDAPADRSNAPKSVPELQQQSREIVDGVSKRVSNVWQRVLSREDENSVASRIRRRAELLRPQVIAQTIGGKDRGGEKDGTGGDDDHGDNGGGQLSGGIFVDEQQHPQTASGETFTQSQRSRAHATQQPGRTRHILFFGDSLVNGVGCEGDTGPELPRKAARYLADRWRVDVSWRALGITGADVRRLREELVPLLRAEVERIRAQSREESNSPDHARRRGADPPIDYVFIVCGVNDWKKCVTTGRSWRPFREDLEQLVREVREICGEECCVVLPALPGVDFAPLFRQPLRTLVVLISNYWDDQKRVLAEKLQHVIYVGKPDKSFWGEDMLSSRLYYAKDNVHPNELGYAKWAEFLVGSISERQGKTDAAGER